MATQDTLNLYERLGGVYNIATVVDDLIDLAHLLSVRRVDRGAALYGPVVDRITVVLAHARNIRGGSYVRLSGAARLRWRHGRTVAHVTRPEARHQGGTPRRISVCA